MRSREFYCTDADNVRCELISDEPDIVVVIRTPENIAVNKPYVDHRDLV
jgi:hypothetical protein